MMELLIVIAIIIIIATGFFLAQTQNIKKGYDAKRKTDLYTIAQALEEYEKDNEAYPAALTLCEAPATGSPLESYIAQVPCDPQDDSNYAYEVGPNATERVWFRIYTKLAQTGDSDIAEVGCLAGCGPGGAYNFYIASPNAPGLAVIGVYPTPFP